MNTKVALVVLTLALVIASRFTVIRLCQVSLPQKASWICQAMRTLELQTMKNIWTLTKKPFGFMVLNRTPIEHVLETFVDPFTRFNMEEYLETVLTSDLTRFVYKVLVKNDREIKKHDSYNILSKYFAMASKLGGKVALRPSQYEAFVNDKDEWITDKYFTQQRLAGVNPMSLMKVTNTWKGLKGNEKGLDWKELKDLLNPKFDWEAAVQTAYGTNDSLREAIDQGRIYALRYEFMDNLPKEPDLTNNDTERKMWDTFSPIALFASSQNVTTKRNHLVPVAIQMDFTPGSAVYTPEDGDNWILAKLNLQITDLGYAQIVEHLGKVHLLMEPFCVILKRAMASEHPLHQMLKYHCRDVTIPNSLGIPALIDRGNYMDQLFAFGSNGTARLLKDAHKIATWEVTDFRGELKIKGLPASIDTKQELCVFVTRIISQLTIQHAAVNYPLSDYAQYIPNLPTKLYNDTRAIEGEFDVLRLPNRNTSTIEASFTNSLALNRFDTIFDYGNDLKETRAVKLLNRYFGYLMNVVQPEMQAKNEQRKEDGDLTYPYFIPRWLPNGIQT